MPYDYSERYRGFIQSMRPNLSPSANYSITCKHKQDPQDKRLVCKPYGDYKHVITNKVKSESGWAGWEMDGVAAIQIFTPLNQ